MFFFFELISRKHNNKRIPIPHLSTIGSVYRFTAPEWISDDLNYEAADGGVRTFSEIGHARSYKEGQHLLPSLRSALSSLLEKRGLSRKDSMLAISLSWSAELVEFKDQ